MKQSQYHKILRFATEKVKDLNLESINFNINAIDNARTFYDDKIEKGVEMSSEERSKLVMVRCIVVEQSRDYPRQITMIHIHSVHYYDRLKKWQKIKTEQKEKLF